MSPRPSVTPASARTRPMPAGAGARLDGAHAALDSLRGEERRLARLGLDGALARCRAEIRYWEFLAALFSLPAGSCDARPAHEAW